jgi:hypothetical protein
MYKIVVKYDENPVPIGIYSYSDELQAHKEFAKFIDWGFADETSVVEMTCPSGKVYTKKFRRGGSPEESSN